MQFSKINYRDLNSRQKEIYNFQKVAALLADYGFNCIKLADDWQGADFIACRRNGETLKVQLKSRPAIHRKYIGKEVYVAFPLKGEWYLIGHDDLLKKAKQFTNWLNTGSWIKKGSYSSRGLDPTFLKNIRKNRL